MKPERAANNKFLESLENPEKERALKSAEN